MFATMLLCCVVFVTSSQLLHDLTLRLEISITSRRTQAVHELRIEVITQQMRTTHPTLSGYTSTKCQWQGVAQQTECMMHTYYGTIVSAQHEAPTRKTRRQTIQHRIVVSNIEDGMCTLNESNAQLSYNSLYPITLQANIRIISQ